MGNDLVKVWIEEIWLKHTQADCNRLGYENSLLSFDDFATHQTDGVKAQLLESNSGCTSKCQSVDVNLNKPFKAVLKRCWVKYVASAADSFPDANSDITFKLPVPTRHHMINWVKEGSDYLVQDQEMVKTSFQVCGISSSDPHKVRNDAYFKQCIGKTLHNLEDNDAKEIDGDPFELYSHEIHNKSL